MAKGAQDVRGAVIGCAVFSVAAFLATWLIWSTLQNHISGSTEEFTAVFTDASGLHEGDDVRIAGVKVGRIEGMELAGDRAAVTFSVRTDQHVFENTRAQLRYQNLTGQRYLALTPGAGAARPLPAGSTIPVDRTDPSFDLGVLLGGLEPLFSVLEPAELNRLAENLIALLQGEGPALNRLLDQAATLTSDFAERDELIGAVLTDLADVLEHLAGKRPQFERLLDRSEGLVNGLNKEAKPIFRAIERIGRVSSSMTGLASDLRPVLRTDLRKFNQVAALFRSEERAVEGTIRSLPDFLEGTARITQHGSWMNLYACRLNVKVPGLPEGTVGDLMGTTHSEPCR